MTDSLPLKPTPDTASSVPLNTGEASEQPMTAEVPMQPLPPQGQQQSGQVSAQMPEVSSELVRQKVHHSYIWLGSLRVAGIMLVVAFFAVLSSVLQSTAKGEPLSLDGGPSLLHIGVGVIAAFAAFVVLVALVQIVSYKHLYYQLGNEEFNLYSGVFNKKHVHIPYQRVQSVNQQASLIQRIFGVCTINIDTAGGASNKAVVVPYLQNSDAERLRGEIFARKQAVLTGQAVPLAQTPAQQSGSGNVLDMPAEIISDVRGVFGGAAVETGSVSYEYGMSNKELLFTGLSNNTGFVIMVFVAISSIIGLAGQIFGPNFGKVAIDGSINFVAQAFAGNTLWALVGVTLALLAVVWLASAIGASISYGGFRACRRDSRIEVEHGLLQHRFHGVDIGRVQSVVVRQSFIRRLFGYCELSLGKIDALTEDSSEQQKSLNPQGLIIHPFVKMNRVPEILAGLVPEFADVPLESTPVAPIALRRALIRRGLWQGGGFWFAIIVSICLITMNAFSAQITAQYPDVFVAVNSWAIVAYIICMLLFVLDLIGAVLWFRGSGFAYNRGFLQVSNGGFARESVSIPRQKIQYGFTEVNPLQQMARVATINARTAAGVGGTTLRLLDATEEEALAWLDWVRPGGSMLE